jgi:hypothetical protein
MLKSASNFNGNAELAGVEAVEYSVDVPDTCICPPPPACVAAGATDVGDWKNAKPVGADNGGTDQPARNPALLALVDNSPKPSTFQSSPAATVNTKPLTSAIAEAWIDCVFETIRVTAPCHGALTATTLLRALTTDCRPCVETSPTDRTEIPLMKVFTEFTRVDNSASTLASAAAVAVPTDIESDNTLFSCEMALAACALTADNSFEVTLPPPPPPAEMRLLNALRMLCKPCVDTSPADRAESALRAAFTLVTRPSTDVAAALAVLAWASATEAA